MGSDRTNLSGNFGKENFVRNMSIVSMEDVGL